MTEDGVNNLATCETCEKLRYLGKDSGEYVADQRETVVHAVPDTEIAGGEWKTGRALEIAARRKYRIGMGPF
jgi:hypothetical protein